MRKSVIDPDRLEPETHAFPGRFGLVYIFPVEVGFKLRMLAVAEAIPDFVERHVVRRTQRMIGRPLHATERGDLEAAQRFRMFLARAEQMLVDAAAAMRFLQHRLAAIENLGKVVTGVEERFADFGDFIGQRQAGASRRPAGRRRKPSVQMLRGDWIYVCR